MQTVTAELDLEVSRIIKAPRDRVWNAWVDPERLAKWWIPHPLICRVVSLDVRPGGAFVTEMSENDGPFAPHLSACFLDVLAG
ncbi:SRPBCC domain-containing protein, partial [Martelella mediterranea]